MGSFKELYDDIADRKGESLSPLEYSGGNGRIDRATELIRSWHGQVSGSLLDIGGATGNLGYSLRDMFFDRVVIDIVEACRRPAEAKGNRFICMNVDEHGLSGIPDGSVGVIAMLDVIEHVLDPQSLVRECHRVMSGGGFLLINTPNIQFWRHLHSLVVEGSFPHTSGDREVYHGGHVSFFNLHDLDQIVGESGFVDGYMVTAGLDIDPPPPIWMQLARYKDKAKQLTFADLVYVARKPA